MKKTIVLDNQEFQFERYPLNSDYSLQAWDAADEYLYEYLYEYIQEQQVESILIYNDSFGFLSLTLHNFHPLTISDSACSHKAINDNAGLNSITTHKVCFPGEESGLFDVIVFKMVKSLELLSLEIYLASKVLKPGGKIVLSGMSKHIHRSTITLFEKHFHSVSTSLAKKKARLLYASDLKEGERLSASKPFPVIKYKDLTITSHPGVFSSKQIDDGTQFLIETITLNPETKTIIDLGCGNGIIGIYLAKYHDIKKIIFSDDSCLAIKSAKENWINNITTKIEADFLMEHSLESMPDDSVDLVVTNPPYHQGFTNTMQIARSFFSDAYRVLKKGGELRLVANNHLGYFNVLDIMYTSVTRVVKNSNYTIYKAVK